MQPAGLLVEIAQPGGQARHVALAMERLLGNGDRIGQRTLEGDEAAFLALLGGEPEQRLLGRLDLLAAVQLRRLPEGVVDHVLADVDQLPAQPGIVDRPAVLAGIDDADHRGQQLPEIGNAADLVEHSGMLELGPERDRIRKLPGLDAPGDGLEDPAMQRVGEVVRRQELADPVVRLVVGQQRAEQRLLRLQVGRRQPLRQAEQALALRRFDLVHALTLAPCQQ